MRVPFICDGLQKIRNQQQSNYRMFLHEAKKKKPKHRRENERRIKVSERIKKKKDQRITRHFMARVTSFIWKNSYAQYYYYFFDRF